MSSDFNISRRKFLGAAAGAAGMAALGPFAARGVGAGAESAVGERIVPPGKLSIQHFSIRDAITRRSIANSRANGLTPTMGYLGGPDFPEDPADIGPLVELPGGFQEVFEYLASVGYRGIEFFQYTRTSTSSAASPARRDPRLPRRRRARVDRHAHRRALDGEPGHPSAQITSPTRSATR